MTFSINERIFSNWDNRFDMITGRNIMGMNFSKWMATVPFVSRLSIFDSTRTSRVKLGLFCFGIRENMRNV